MIRKVFSYLLLLCLVVKGASSAMADEVFKKYSGNLTEGEYLISYNGHLMKAQVNGDKLDQVYKQNEQVFTNPDESLVWTIKADGNYFTLYNESTQKYAASTSKANQLALVKSVTDNTRWSVSGTTTYEFKNHGISSKNFPLQYPIKPFCSNSL